MHIMNILFLFSPTLFFPWFSSAIKLGEWKCSCMYYAFFFAKQTTQHLHIRIECNKSRESMVVTQELLMPRKNCFGCSCGLSVFPFCRKLECKSFGEENVNERFICAILWSTLLYCGYCSSLLVCFAAIDLTQESYAR